MTWKGEGAAPATNDDDEPGEITNPTSISSPHTPVPTPIPRASRPTVRMLWGLTNPPDTPPGGQKHPRDVRHIADGSKAKKNKNSQSNVLALNISHESCDELGGEGEDRSPACTPALAPAPAPRVSRTFIRVYHDA